MKISAALADVQRLYVDVAPLIYFVEEHPAYVDRMQVIFVAVQSTPIVAVSSVITLTEVLSHPLRLGKTQLVQEYRDILLNSGSFVLLPVIETTADIAAGLRARYRLKTPDALHLATALETGCDAFLTNDLSLRRVAELRVLVLDDLELDTPPTT